jgi:APA family basic amino acid/polyamine antiporter
MSKSASGLVKTFGFYTAFLLVAGSMIGSGVFKKVAPMASELCSPQLILLAWILAGFITLLGALTNAEVAGLIAEPGGQYAYFKKMYGKPFAFIYGWSSLAVIQSATAASVAYVFAQSLNTLIELPRLSPAIEAWNIVGVFYPFDNFGVRLVTIGLLMTLSVINIRGVNYGGWVLKIFASAVIACIIAIILFCIFLSNGSVSNLNYGDASDMFGNGSGSFFGVMFTSMMAAFWAYEGWNTIGFLGGEIKNPYKNIPKALTYGTLFVICIYVAVNAAYLYALNYSALDTLNHEQNSIAAVEVVRSFMGYGGAVFILILIIMSTFNSTNTTIMGAPRIYFAMARDGLLFHQLGKIHSRFKTPSAALLVQGFWSSVLVLSGSFDQLTDMLIFAAFIFYGAGAMGVFVLRSKMKDTPRPYKVFGYPFVPALFVIFCFILVIVSVYERPREAAIGLSLILTGLPVYVWTRIKYPEHKRQYYEE